MYNLKSIKIMNLYEKTSMEIMCDKGITIIEQKVLNVKKYF